jgi:hypothetical protein
MSRRRQKAWTRWLICKRAMFWLRHATGNIGDFYWTSGEDYRELRRRGFVDKYERVTAKGRRAAAIQ